MRVFLIGMMGSGKTTIGKRISEILDMEFIDMDDEIEKRENMKIKDIFDKKGEKYFRKVEKELLKELIKKDNIVVSTGGGIILDEGNRNILKREKTLFLYVPIDELVKRVDTQNRPLLKCRKERLYEIWEKRKKIYEEFEKVNLSGLNVTKSCAKVIMKFIEDDNKYFLNTVHPVRISIGSFKELKKEDGFFITSESVYEIYNEFMPECMVLPDGEKAKDIEIAKRCYEELIKNNFSRNDTIVGIGGGTITDLAGFVASTFKRGTKLVLYPTTLLAQVDAAIGGKNGLNFYGVKNMIGTIKMPDMVVIDPATVISTGDRYAEGLIEAFKMFILFEDGYEEFKEKINELKKGNIYVMKDMIKKAVELKLKIVEKDPYDNDIRHSLNFGHTLGHVFEAITKLPHGVCVGWGMIKEMEFFKMKELVDDKIFHEIECTVRSILKDHTFDERIEKEDAVEYLKNDKKGFKNFVKVPVVKDIGKFELKVFEMNEILDIL